MASLDAIHEAALAGLKEHDRLVLAKNQMERRLRERRASSKLPDLLELALSRPIVSTGMIQEVLKVSKQGALNVVGQLGLPEMTGQGKVSGMGVSDRPCLLYEVIELSSHVALPAGLMHSMPCADLQTRHLLQPFQPYRTGTGRLRQSGLRRS
ncbi:helix-turn-helix domain-containing protein [Mesorhizobium sp. M4A.F.Ca.ET.022.05.2.1]|uniref:helix-turn-helix domain-containing protein n=1 Tax=Mesorhizobium sp. M4A.F.Ca.ET.022.05.2.1 TaxID=2496653 RepID=UPI001FE01C24|nr:helix-turn-helix domain-containing protein [Mesorhizobium sp. M4A.F.Ca.ET.022.05.2.1]